MNLKLGVISACAAFAGINLQADLLISGIYDGDLSDPKGIEVFVTASGDYSSWTIGAQFNANPWGEVFAFSSLADANFSAGDYLYITSTPGTLTTWGWDAKGTIIEDTSFNANGDDRFGIFDGSATLVDIFGEENVDGTGSAWEYTDSYAYRIDGTGPSAVFSESEWTFGGINFLEGVDQQAFLTSTFGTYAVPEPSTIAAIFGLVGLGLVLMRRRR